MSLSLWTSLKTPLDVVEFCRKIMPSYDMAVMPFLFVIKVSKNSKKTFILVWKCIYVLVYLVCPIWIILYLLNQPRIYEVINITIKNSVIKKMQQMCLDGLKVPEISLTLGISEPTVRKYTSPPYFYADMNSRGVLEQCDNPRDRVDIGGRFINGTNIRYDAPQNQNLSVTNQRQAEDYEQLLRRMERYEERDKQREQDVQEIKRTHTEILQKLNGVEQKLKEVDTITQQLEPLKKEILQLETWSQELKQIVGSIIKELAGVKQENKESKGIIQKHAQELRDFKQHNNDNLDIIQNRFNKYEEISKKETALREDFEVFKKQVQKDLKSNTFDWSLIVTGAGILIAGVGVPLAVYYFQNKFAKLASPTRTLQHLTPGSYVYDQKRATWIFYPQKNSVSYTSDSTTSIKKEIDQNQTESPILKSGSDQPVITKKKNPAENTDGLCLKSIPLAHVFSPTS
jgi:hypothetical protein